MADQNPSREPSPQNRYALFVGTQQIIEASVEQSDGGYVPLVVEQSVTCASDTGTDFQQMSKNLDNAGDGEGRFGSKCDIPSEPTYVR